MKAVYVTPVRTPLERERELQRARYKRWRERHPGPRKMTPEQKAAACARARRWRAENIERVRERKSSEEHKRRRNQQQRDAYALDPEPARRKSRAHKDKHREAINARSRARYPLVADKSRAASKAWRKENPGRAQAHWDIWRKAHPETPGQAQARWNKRRARLRDGRSRGLASAEWDAIVECFGSACAYCLRAGVRLTRDHVEPLDRGGLDEPGNVVPACRACNSSKGARLLITWFGQRL